MSRWSLSCNRVKWYPNSYGSRRSLANGKRIYMKTTRLSGSFSTYELNEGHLASLSLSSSRTTRLAEELCSTDFNLWNWDESELHIAIMGMFEDSDLLKSLGVRRSKLLKCVRAIEHGYFGNVYHSFIHAIDVLQMCYFLVTECHGREIFGLSNRDIFVLFLAALAHDIGHPGLNNLYQIKANTDLARRYHNDAVLENYSCTLLFRLMKKYRILDQMDRVGRESILEQLHQTILYTDMERHFSLLEEMQTTRDGHPPVSLVLRMLLHAADISNPCRPWKLAKQWSECIVEEFFNQGILEKIHGYSISPNMDRNTVNQVQVSLGFVDTMVLPFFEELVHFLPKSHVLVDQLLKNRCAWQAMKLAHSNVSRCLISEKTVSDYHHHRSHRKTIITPSLASLSGELEIRSSSDELIPSPREKVSYMQGQLSSKDKDMDGSRQYAQRTIVPSSSFTMEASSFLSLIGEDVETTGDTSSPKLHRRWSVQPTHVQDVLSCRRPSLLSSSSSSLLIPEDYLAK
jgi:hypothetical protein